ncbi:hypothetical protein CES86_0063 [Brucella lupini]|uniref:Uncharacterized protein n=1 Tax=Brucella lupini TaxID=255457 RepID=A0A256GZ00_9HYPH|nr:hypothetical protein CES86_0063 [Brucella lupini]
MRALRRAAMRFVILWHLAFLSLSLFQQAGHWLEDHRVAAATITAFEWECGTEANVVVAARKLVPRRDVIDTGGTGLPTIGSDDASNTPLVRTGHSSPPPSRSV